MWRRRWLDGNIDSYIIRKLNGLAWLYLMMSMWFDCWGGMDCLFLFGDVGCMDGRAGRVLLFLKLCFADSISVLGFQFPSFSFGLVFLSCTWYCRHIQYIHY